MTEVDANANLWLPRTRRHVCRGSTASLANEQNSHAEPIAFASVLSAIEAVHYW